MRNRRKIQAIHLESILGKRFAADPPLRLDDLFDDVARSTDTQINPGPNAK